MIQKFSSNVVIGLEIHIELDTKSKLFCYCARTGSEEPNTRTCVTCLGMPGSKPVLNKKAVEYALKLALATKSKIADELIFSRKSYFYPDMAKNYQITQYELPLATDGKVKLESGKEINLKRIHMEEDPAALVHPGGISHSSFVLVDYNRSGNPLVEVVTEPEMTSAEEARDFMKKLIVTLEYLEIFDVNNCVIKADANVSIKESGYTRAEIKNITGFRDIERALKYEIQRQKKEIEEKNIIHQETRAWDSERGITFSLRTKETEDDYGYIIDPDLVKIELTTKMIDKIKANMPELADEKLKKFTGEHNISEEMAKILSKDKTLALLFEKVAEEVNPELAAKYVRKEIPRVLNYNKKTLEESKIDDKKLIDLLKLLEKNKITDKTAQKILEHMVDNDIDIKEYVEKHNLVIFSDDNLIKNICEKVMAGNQNVVEDYKKGNEKSFNFLVGQVMKETKGKASPKEINEILKELIK